MTSKSREEHTTELALRKLNKAIQVFSANSQSYYLKKPSEVAEAALRDAGTPLPRQRHYWQSSPKSGTGQEDKIRFALRVTWTTGLMLDSARLESSISRK